jgi:hypothetical protein
VETLYGGWEEVEERRDKAESRPPVTGLNMRVGRSEGKG